MHRIVILGGGTGGTLAANRLRKIYGLIRRLLPSSIRTIVTCTAGLVVHPLRSRHDGGHHATRGQQLHDGINYVSAAVEKVEIGSNSCASSMEGT